MNMADGMRAFLCAVVMTGLLSGCGLIMDAAELVRPIVPDLPNELDLICRHRQVQVGIADEPFPPFVFPAFPTNEGPKITGLDIDLVERISAALSAHCGHPVVTKYSVVPFRDLFMKLTEGKLDLFVSGMAANVPHLTATGLGYSTPYFTDTGIIGMARGSRVAEQVRVALRRTSQGDSLEARKASLAGLTIAVQGGRSPYLYAMARLKDVQLVVCDTLAAALASDPPVDLILGKAPFVDYLPRQEHREWRPLLLEDGQLFFLSRENYAIAMGESSYGLRWLVNDVLYDLELSGRLDEMRRNWVNPDYAYSRRARGEGVLCPACRTIQPREPGRCRLEKLPPPER